MSLKISAAHWTSYSARANREGRVMRVTVNGKPLQVHIGCRSFVWVTHLLGLLAFSPSSDLVVSVNGKLKDRQDFATTQIKSGDKVSILLREARN